jgi:hypothetical protein
MFSTKHMEKYKTEELFTKQFNRLEAKPPSSNAPDWGRFNCGDHRHAA